VLEVSPHHEGVFVAIKICQAVHVVVIAVEAVVHVELGVKVFARQVALRHLVHVTEAVEAVGPGEFAVFVEEEPALPAFTVFQLPVTEGTSVYAILLVPDNSEAKRLLGPT
jgi:hypothetical protein